ncbi:MAG: type II toxin-antitoxin system VapC family toxin [Deltaproteobacteria bacterium]|nr:type II toxin-antitoxin system VapC family toxin [Deltaproteobacteria bacterium]
MIFIDSNVPMYLIGGDHPCKREAKILLERLVSEKERLVTNTEVFQEIMHRYTAVQNKEAIQPAFDALYGMVDEVYPMIEHDVLSAKDILFSYPNLSARDAIHAAQMKRLKIERIFSFDRGFDELPSLVRIP